MIRSTDRILPSPTVGLALVIALPVFGCVDQDRVADFPADRSMPVELDSLESLPFQVGTLEDVAMSADGRLFGLDKRNMHVVAVGTDGIDNTDGTPVLTFGRHGQGPGEFSEPRRLALGDSLLVVGDRNTRFSVFGLDGSFRNSFVVPGIRFMNSNLVVIGDSVVAIGGYVEGSGSLLDGRFVHLVRIDGTRLADVVPLSGSAMAAESVTTAGVSVALQDGTLWAIQSTEYTLSRIDVRTWTELEPLKLRPDYFRPLVTKEPPMPALIEWVREFDVPSGLHALGESVLLVTVSLTAYSPFKYSLDFVDTRTGTVFHSFVSDEKVVGVDTVSRLIYLEGELDDDEQIAWLNRYRYSFGEG